MMTLAQRHRQRMAAQKESAAAADAALDPARGEYELMLAKLATDKRRLKEIQSIERKIEAKRAMLPDYQPYLDGVLAADAGLDDQVLTTCLVWHIDTGDYRRALDLGGYALRHGLGLPDQYQRDLPTTLAEEIAEGVLRTDAVSGYWPEIKATLELVQDRDMPDEVRAKLHKAAGTALALIDKAQALTHLERALALHDRVGVKKEIERLQRELKKEQPD